MIALMTKPPTVAETIAHRVRKYRQERGWSVRQLAEECAKRGATTLTQASLTNIERGLTPKSTRGSRAVSVEEMLTLAVVLEVPPAMLMLPFGDHNSVEVSPGVATDPSLALHWIFGSHPLDSEGFGYSDPPVGFTRAANVMRLIRNVDYENAKAEYARMQARANVEGAQARYEERLREYAEAFWSVVNAGLVPPTIPKRLYDDVMALAPLPENLTRPMLPPSVEVVDSGDS